MLVYLQKYDVESVVLFSALILLSCSSAYTRAAELCLFKDGSEDVKEHLKNVKCCTFFHKNSFTPPDITGIPSVCILSSISCWMCQSRGFFNLLLYSRSSAQYHICFELDLMMWLK